MSTWVCKNCKARVTGDRYVWVWVSHVRECMRTAPAPTGAENEDAYYAAKAATVKRATLWNGVVDTFQTEAELNGFRASQGMLL